MRSIIAASLIPLGCFAAEDVPKRASGIGLAMIPENTRGPVAETITDEQLLAKRAAENATISKPTPPRPQSFGLLEMSTILQSGTDFLLLPKGSVLWCPPALKSRIVNKPSGNMTTWQTFLTANRNWITHYEVTQSQVIGKTPIPPETIERFTKGNTIVVATMNGNPITVVQSAP